MHKVLLVAYAFLLISAATFFAPRCDGTAPMGMEIGGMPVAGCHATVLVRK